MRSAERRCSATLVALRLYQLDHAGRFPNRLAELGGVYLPEVPSDPMAASGRLVGYGRSGGTVFVYSVGTNGRDDIAAGSFTPTADDLNSWDARIPDYVLMLDRKAAATQPAPASAPSAAPATF